MHHGALFAEQGATFVGEVGGGLEKTTVERHVGSSLNPPRKDNRVAWQPTHLVIENIFTGVHVVK